MMGWIIIMSICVVALTYLFEAVFYDEEHQ